MARADDWRVTQQQQVIIKSTVRPFPALAVVVDGTLSHRLTVFNVAIERLTVDLLSAVGAQINASSSTAAVAAAAANRRRYNDLVLQSAANVVVVNDNNYLRTLTTRFPLVKVLVLPWVLPTQSLSSSHGDLSNLDVRVREDNCCRCYVLCFFLLLYLLK